MPEAPSLPAPFRWEGDQIAAELGGGHVRFTTRRGGVSEAPYDSFNLGDHVGDDPSAVAENRARAAAAIGVPGWSHLRWALQVHGTTVRTDDTAAFPQADGQATATPGVPVAVFAADCVPVALATDDAVAVVHAGWKGLADGVIAKGVEALGGGAVQAAIGPCARGCCYEVGEEVHARFTAYDARRGEGNLALEAIARAQLEAAGATVHDTGLCTLCTEPGVLFSHRRDGGTTGRQAAIAWR